MPYCICSELCMIPRSLELARCVGNRRCTDKGTLYQGQGSALRDRSLGSLVTHGSILPHNTESGKSGAYYAGIIFENNRLQIW